MIEGLVQGPSYLLSVSWEDKDRIKGLKATYLSDPRCKKRFYGFYSFVKNAFLNIIFQWPNSLFY